MAEEPQSPKTALGVNENVAAALAYILGWISGVAVLVLEKENKVVRFHAMQSIAVFAPLTILTFVAPSIPVLGGLIAPLVGAATVILLIVLVVTAYQGTELKLPYVTEWAENQIN
jgi:uncharacterized membrane protein